MPVQWECAEEGGLSENGLRPEDYPKVELDEQVDLKRRRRAKTDTSLLPFLWHGLDWVDPELSSAETTDNSTSSRLTANSTCESTCYQSDYAPDLESPDHSPAKSVCFGNEPMKLVTNCDALLELEGSELPAVESDRGGNSRRRRRAQTDTSLLPLQWDNLDWVDPKENDLKFGATASPTSEGNQFSDEPITLDLRGRRRAKTDMSLLPFTWHDLEWVGMDDSSSDIASSSKLSETTASSTSEAVKFGEEAIELVLKDTLLECDGDEVPIEASDAQVNSRCRRRAKTDACLLPSKWDGSDWFDVDDSTSAVHDGIPCGNDERFIAEPMNSHVKDDTFLEHTDDEMPTLKSDGQMNLRCRRRAQTDTSLCPLMWHGADWVEVGEQI